MSESEQARFSTADVTDVEEIRGEILRTSGISSVVRDPDGEPLGHVFMTEWDDIENVMDPVSVLDRMPGVSLLLSSSPGSFHGYNFSVRPFETQITDAARKTGDLGHVRASAQRGYFVLRVVEKIREESREAYKDAPQVAKAFVSESEHPQSLPHLRFFVDLARDQGSHGVADKLGDAIGSPEIETVGDGFDVDHYQTGTDSLKRRLIE
jgi:hypothetical protein